MRITKNAVTRTCAVCERRLLMGEWSTRFSPEGGEFVDVCALCHEVALEHGWVKEGAPMTPTVPAERRRRRARLVRLLAPRRAEADTVLSEPMLRRLSERELAVVEAADLFNASTHRRTVGGIAKSLGPPKASIMRLSGVNADVVVTIAWDISWYQYRVTPESAQPVRLAERGYDVSELDGGFTAWNAELDEEGRLVPELARA